MCKERWLIIINEGLIKDNKRYLRNLLSFRDSKLY